MNLSMNSLLSAKLVLTLPIKYLVINVLLVFPTGSVSSAGFCIGLISNLLVISHLLTKTWQRSKLRGSNLTRGRVASRDTLFLVLATVDLVITGLHVVCAISLLSQQEGKHHKTKRAMIDEFH